MEANMNMNINDFTSAERAVLGFVSIDSEFTLETFCEYLTMYSELKEVKEPEQTLNSLVEKGMAKIVTIKNRKDKPVKAYRFLYAIRTQTNGQAVFYDLQQALQEMTRLRNEICP